MREVLARGGRAEHFGSASMASETPVLPTTPLTLGIAVVRLLLQRGYSLGVTQIANELKMPKSSIHRLLQTLGQLGFVQKQPGVARYTLNPSIFRFVHEIATHFGRNLSLDDLLREAAQKLKCSIYLSMLGGREVYVVYAAGEEGNTTRLGTHSPAFATSAGKVLVSQLPEADWPQYAPSADETRITAFTNLNPEKFYAQLRDAAARSIAWNHRESSKDGVSLAAVVHEPFVKPARLSVALLMRHESYMTRDQAELEAALLQLATKIEQSLGSR